MDTTTRRRTRVRALLDYTVAVVIALAIWPTSLGGWTTFAVVSGHSMEPTFRHGDLAVAYRVPAQVGDVVVYRAPVEGLTVIHRVVGEAQDGWVVRGDANPAVDPWTPTSGDVVGKVVLRVPGAGHLVAWAGTPAGIATLALLLVAVQVWPSRRRRGVAPAHVEAETHKHGQLHKTEPVVSR